MSHLSRRDLIHGAAAVGVAATGLRASNAHAFAPVTTAQSMRDVPFAPMSRIRAGVIGVGGRGQGVMQDFLNAGVEVLAICDINPNALAQGVARVVKAGQPEPAAYGKDEHHFQALNQRDDLDIVIIATPWDWHVPMAVDAMRHGKHAFVEVPAATTTKDCWALVDTSEATRKHCIMLENCCYGYWEMLIHNMVKAGAFGEIVHGEAAYNHDLRSLLLADSGEGLWRRFPHIKRDGNLYPTHGLGPVARYMNVHRGDRFKSIVSVSSREGGLSTYRNRTLKAGDPKLKEVYKCGDVNTSIIKTELGRTIMLQHNVTSPRPYSRINAVHGTEGIFADYPPRIYLDRFGDDDWHEPDEFKAEYEDPLWRENGERARNSGHGGMDFINAYRQVECMKKGLVPDMNVYDAAAWSAPGPLSDLSVSRGGSAVAFPDFTRGNWR